MIPKIIHYCWFGRGEKPKLAQRCISSWKKFCPDYEIIEWNENNIDVNMNGYTRMCYEEKKYAFLTDFLRLLIVEEHGGVYMDTDVELLRPIDTLLNCESFFGFETDLYVNTGEGFGAVPHALVVKQMLHGYDMLLDGQHGIVGCPQLNTAALANLGLKTDGSLQRFDWGMVYPRDYFNPLNNNTGKLERTNNTYSIHWYAKSWIDPKIVARSRVTRVFHRIFGENCFAWLKK